MIKAKVEHTHKAEHIYKGTVKANQMRLAA